MQDANLHSGENIFTSEAEEWASSKAKTNNPTKVNFNDKTLGLIIEKLKGMHGERWVKHASALTNNSSKTTSEIADRAFHKTGNSMSVLLANINSIELEHRLFTNIVKVSTTYGSFQFHHHGTESLAA